MWIKTYFESLGIPSTGLDPIIRIRNVDDGSVVSSGTMTEVGGGFYKYSFVEYDITKDYCVLCDAISLPSKDRYKFLATGEYGNLINTLSALNTNINSRTTLIRKILTNELVLLDGNNGNWVLYDDNNSTELFTWNVGDKLGNKIIQRPHQVSSRTKGE